MKEPSLQGNRGEFDMDGSFMQMLRGAFRDKGDLEKQKLLKQLKNYKLALMYITTGAISNYFDDNDQSRYQGFEKNMQSEDFSTMVKALEFFAKL